MGNNFLSIEHITSIGEIIICVYFLVKYDRVKAVQFMKWKGFRTDLLYTFNEMFVFYQSERFVPKLDSINEFRKTVDEHIWDNAPCNIENDYKYRSITKDITCISFLPLVNEATEETGKIKKE